MSRENYGLEVSMMMWRIHDTEHTGEINGQENQDECGSVSRESQGAAGEAICTMETDVEKYRCETRMVLKK